jgi:D-apionolactonase
MQIWNNISRRLGNLSRRQALKLGAAAGGAVVMGQSEWNLTLPPSAGTLPSGLGAETRRESGLPRSVLYYGTEEPLPEVIELRAGSVSMTFETKNAFLRYIRLGDREILRGVYVAVRDRNWGAVAPRIFNLKREVNGASFQLHFDVECKEGDIDFPWRGSITGSKQGCVEFSMNGAARSTFKRNRLGFAVLHPIRECAGQSCKVEKVDGTTEQGTFPRFVSPQQPFKDMRAISHQVVPGVTARVAFEGDIFEMEDQRNWTDASYKTYCTPLSLPYPVEVPSGTTVAQTVRLSVDGELPSNLTKAPLSLPEVTLSLGDKPPVPLPRIGLGVASHSQPLTSKEKQRLKALSLSHLRVDLKLSETSHKQTLSRAAADAKELGVSLELALFLSDSAESELSGLVKELEQAKPPVSSWLIFQTNQKSTQEPAVRLARRILSSYGSKAKFGAGTNAYFAEFNRGHPPIEALDLACYSMNPQVHAVDNATLVETLEAQRGTVESAKQFVGKLPLAISPITLKPRFNPAATGPEPQPAPGELPSQVDVRQMSLFGAGWTLGSIKNLAASGTSSLTYYETTGWRGVMEIEPGSALPQKFRSIPGGVFPIYHVLADLGEFQSGSVMPCISSDALSVEGLALQKGDRICLLLANLTSKFQYVKILNSKLRGYIRVKRLDESTAEEAMRSSELFRSKPGLLQQVAANQIEISLLPYALVRVDSTMERG